MNSGFGVFRAKLACFDDFSQCPSTNTKISSRTVMRRAATTTALIRAAMFSPVEKTKHYDLGILILGMCLTVSMLHVAMCVMCVACAACILCCVGCMCVVYMSGHYSVVLEIYKGYVCR